MDHGTSAEAVPGDDEPPGLQAERTQLAWVRTALACAGLAALATRMATGRPAAVVVGVVAGLVAAFGAGAAALRTRALRAEPRPSAPPWQPFALLVAAVAVADVLVLVLLIT